MTVIPWRVKNFLSERFPLLYHLAANFGAKGNSMEHWDARLAKTWDDTSRFWPAKNQLIASLTDPSDAVLDIGCGNGSILRELRLRGYRNLHGLEISEYAIRRLQDEGIKMHFGVLPAIPLEDAQFDVVIASQVLEHVIRRKRLLREMRRVLKPRGQAFIFVPDNCLGPISEREHVIKFNAYTLRKELERFFAICTIQSIKDPDHAAPILFAHVRNAAAPH